MTLDELHTKRDRLKLEAAELRALLVRSISDWVPDRPVPREIHAAFKRLVRTGEDLRDVEEAITAIH
jgi:hypothetical protein